MPSLFRPAPNLTLLRLTLATVATRLAVITLIAVLVLIAPGAVAAQSLVDVADAVDQQGRYLEPAVDSSVDRAIDRANAEGIGFVWVNGNDVESTAKDIMTLLEDAGSRYHTLVVLGDSRVWAESTRYDTPDAVDAMLADLGNGQVADALDVFTSTLTDRLPADTGSSDTGVTGSTDNPTGGGVPWLALIVALIAGFFLFRFVTGRRKAKQAERALIEVDRAEIAEQLKDNADRVINLGDQVIASKDAELIQTYEEASMAYQEVSAELEAAATVEQIDLLDDKIDKAEWQFEVIEARLQGRTPPIAPRADGPDVANEPAPPTAPLPPSRSDRPALGPDESIIGGPGRTSSPTPSSSRTARRTGGMGGLGGMGGGLGGVLGGVLGGMLGSGGRPRSTSRRTQQRRTTTGSYRGVAHGSGSGGSGLGGGVLRPRRPSGGSSGTSSRRGSGGSFGGGSGGRKKGGGGSF